MLFERTSRELVAAGAERPALLVLGDVQWADEASPRLLAHLAPQLRTLPVLLVAPRRVEPGSVHPALLAEVERHALVVHLGGLAATSSRTSSATSPARLTSPAPWSGRTPGHRGQPAVRARVGSSPAHSGPPHHLPGRRACPDPGHRGRGRPRASIGWARTAVVRCGRPRCWVPSSTWSSRLVMLVEEIEDADATGDEAA